MLVIQRPSVEALGEDHATRQRFAVGPLELAGVYEVRFEGVPGALSAIAARRSAM